MSKRIILEAKRTILETKMSILEAKRTILAPNEALDSRKITKNHLNLAF